MLIGVYEGRNVGQIELGRGGEGRGSPGAINTE